LIADAKSISGGFLRHQNAGFLPCNGPNPHKMMTQAAIAQSPPLFIGSPMLPMILVPDGTGGIRPAI
jgi:hypothetical protein